MERKELPWRSHTQEPTFWVQLRNWQHKNLIWEFSVSWTKCDRGSSLFCYYFVERKAKKLSARSSLLTNRNPQLCAKSFELLRPRSLGSIFTIQFQTRTPSWVWGISAIRLQAENFRKEVSLNHHGLKSPHNPFYAWRIQEDPDRAQTWSVLRLIWWTLHLPQDKGASQESRSQTEFQMERKPKCHPGMPMIWFSH